MSVRKALKIALVALVALLAAAAPDLADAHGGERHVMGTVTAIDAERIVVDTTDLKTESLRTTPQTTYERGEAKAAAGDLRVGDRVVVHFTGKGAAETVRLIRFETPKEPPH